MEVFVKTLTGGMLTLQMKALDTVFDLKSEIQEKVGLLVDEQQLIFGGVPLDNKGKLIDYNIQKNSMIHLVQRLKGGNDPINFTVRAITGDSYKIRIDPAKLIFDVKTLITQQIQIPGNQQILNFKGQTLEDSKSVQSYLIEEGSSVNLVIRLNTQSSCEIF